MQQREEERRVDRVEPERVRVAEHVAGERADDRARRPSSRTGPRVAPNSSQRSKVPSPRPASAHEASTTAWPCSARAERPAGQRRRRARRPSAGSASSSARPRRSPRRPPPPASTIAIAANCAEPAKTITDMTIAAPADEARVLRDHAEGQARRARPAIANGMPARTPSRRRCRRSFGVRLVHHRQPARRRGARRHDDRREQPSPALMARGGQRRRAAGSRSGFCQPLSAGLTLTPGGTISSIGRGSRRRASRRRRRAGTRGAPSCAGR